MGFNIGAGVAAALLPIVKAERQTVIDTVVSYGDKGLETIDAAVVASDHIPIISSVLNGAADKVIKGEEAMLPTQVAAAVDGFIKLLARDAGQTG
jgi:hypothetical protein